MLQTARLILEDPGLYTTAEAAIQGVLGISQDAASRGTAVHSFAEYATREISRAEVLDLPPEIQGYVHALVSYREIHQPVPIITECNCFSDEYGYAGTVDFIGHLGASPFIWMIDYKTTKDVWAEARLQEAAYAHAEYLVPHLPSLPCPTCSAADPIAEGPYGPVALRDCPECLGGGMVYDIKPMPRIDRTAVVLFRPDGSFRFVETRAPFEVFEALLKVWAWQRDLD